MFVTCHALTFIWQFYVTENVRFTCDNLVLLHDIGLDGWWAWKYQDFVTSLTFFAHQINSNFILLAILRASVSVSIGNQKKGDFLSKQEIWLRRKKKNHGVLDASKQFRTEIQFSEVKFVFHLANGSGVSPSPPTARRHHISSQSSEPSEKDLIENKWLQINHNLCKRLSQNE